MSVEAVPAPERLTEAQARELTDRIRATLHTGHKLLLAAWVGCAHEALEHGRGAAGWAAYCEAEFADARMLRLDAEARRGLVGELRQARMPTTAIATALGITRPTVDRDRARLASSGHVEPATVRSLDGRDRPSRRSPTRLAPAPVESDGQAVASAQVADPAHQLALWHTRFLAEIDRAARLVAWPAEDIAANADPRARRLYEQVVDHLVDQRNATRAPGPSGATVTTIGGPR